MAGPKGIFPTFFLSGFECSTFLWGKEKRRRDLSAELRHYDHVDEDYALLPTLGGQTALNLAMELVENGVLERYGVELIGANAEAIATAEDREQFKQAMIEIGLDVPSSGTAHTTR